MIEGSLRKSLIVIPSLNGGSRLERALATLRVPSDIILVLDQGSTDNTEAICASAGVSLTQLNTQRTFSEACNIGAEIARSRGCEFLFVGHNDIALRTDVVRELLTAMLEDSNLGIAAPSQIIVDREGPQTVAYRASWDLQNLAFGHDFATPEVNTERIESDFCELTFAAIRMSAIEDIGFLDSDYGSCHEDADFCHRLRQAGYSCAYFPQSQIERRSGPTLGQNLSRVHQDGLSKSKSLFATKHLQNSLRHVERNSGNMDARSRANRHLHGYLKKFGLIRQSSPELILAHPGDDPFDYLYTAWETTRLPRDWRLFKDSYKAVFAPSRWNVEILTSAGYGNVFHAPLGVETDLFHPWGAAHRLYEGPTFLWVGQNQFRNGLDVLLAAWQRFREQRPGARLVLLGKRIRSGISATPMYARRWGDFSIFDYDSDGISVYEPVATVDDQTLATIYRSVDFTICCSRSESFGMAVAESMACGTPAIFGNYGGTREFSFDGALLLNGAPAAARCDDEGFDDPGEWWEPDTSHLSTLMVQAHDMGRQAYRANARRGMQIIRSRYTWRTTVIALRHGLRSTDQGSPTVATSAAGSGSEATAQRPLARRRFSFIARNFKRLGYVVFLTSEKWELGGAGAALHELGEFVGSRIKRKAEAIQKYVVRRAEEFPGSDTIRRLWRTMQHRSGVLFIGYAEGGLGLGESFRGLLAAAAQQELDFKIHPLRTGVETRIVGPFMPERYDRSHSFDVNVIEVAADQVPRVFESLDPRRYRDSYNVLRTYWELPAAPQEWKAMLNGIDEVWVPNEYVQSAFRGIFDGPLSVVPPHVTVSAPNPKFDRAYFGLEPDRFYFIFSFDYHSSEIRKNPLGAIRAFCDAFPAASDNVGLVIKSVGRGHTDFIKNTIRRYAETDPRIVLIEEAMSREELVGLMRVSDCYLSLHRAEGFGLGMAEAMLLGKAVIGTRFSGNVDFLTDATGFPIGFRMRGVRSDEYLWPRGQSWAVPDHGEAVKAIRLVYQDAELRERKARAGQAFIREHYGVDAVGAAVKARLDAIAAAQARRRAGAP
jgi:glycosyltransferase involved in cell wall biosynthesis